MSFSRWRLFYLHGLFIPYSNHVKRRNDNILPDMVKVQPAGRDQGRLSMGATISNIASIGNPQIKFRNIQPVLPPPRYGPKWTLFRLASSRHWKDKNETNLCVSHCHPTLYVYLCLLLLRNGRQTKYTGACIAFDGEAHATNAISTSVLVSRFCLP